MIIYWIWNFFTSTFYELDTAAMWKIGMFCSKVLKIFYQKKLCMRVVSAIFSAWESKFWNQNVCAMIYINICVEHWWWKKRWIFFNLNNNYFFKNNYFSHQNQNFQIKIIIWQWDAKPENVTILLVWLMHWVGQISLAIVMWVEED